MRTTSPRCSSSGTCSPSFQSSFTSRCWRCAARTKRLTPRPHGGTARFPARTRQPRPPEVRDTARPGAHHRAHQRTIVVPGQAAVDTGGPAAAARTGPALPVAMSAVVLVVAAAAVAGWLTLATRHVGDDYRVGHLQGVWIAAAEAARHREL